ncbi:MAG: sulfide-dependent adenosine diphosphate thiazole synthase [Actinobacteria bacterium]|nr:sulfide-dependent adenosine diphosphate thiazole synthase [Actinomycetota bacterium]
MPLSETEITRRIVEGFSREFLDSLELDVAIAGAGPSGLVAAFYLAREGLKVNVFERNLYVGGGIWGGGMLFARIVVQEEAAGILDEMGVKLDDTGDGYLAGDPVEVVSRCTVAAIDAGARVWVGMTVEDVMIRENDVVTGVVLNWRAVELSGMHVDPLALSAKVVIDATGHDCNVVRTVERKVPGCRIETAGGVVVGEKPMWAEVGEREIVDNTREVYPGMMVCGMAANTVFGSPRMGAIFGGMFLSGRKVAELAAGKVRGGA